MSIVATDPFDTLLYQQQLISTPLEERGANGSDDLDVAQRAFTIGDMVPVVFGRRIGNVGGVLISPGATEARFENNASNEVTASYHLVLSEGVLDGIQVRDVFQRSCRVGSLTQTYNRRAGPWLPGNFITPQAGFTPPECPYYCGTGGTYEDMTTASYVIAGVPDGDTRWDRQVHVFIRGGMHVTRLLDAVTGPSNNVADLALWLLQRTGRMPADLIDVAAFTSAADFTEKTGLWFNGELAQSANFEDWLASRARYFLLSKSKRDGKVGLRPSLPVDGNNEIDTSPITPVWQFNVDNLILPSFNLSWIPLSDRKPFCALMLWRQQPDDDIGLIRTTEVRYEGQAVDGPFEQHDLSEFATSENHVVKVGANIVARRRYIAHTLTVKAKPEDYAGTVYQGQIVQVVLPRVASRGAPGEHRYLYEIDRMGRSPNGEVTLDLIHFPVDVEGRSLVALDVAAATGGGILLDTGKSGTSCDVNSDSDLTIPVDDSLDPSLWPLPGDDAFDVDLPLSDFGTGTLGDGLADGDGYGGFGTGTGDGFADGDGGFGGGGFGGAPAEGTGGEGDPIDDQDEGPPEIGVPPEGPYIGASLTAPDCGCQNTSIQWFSNGVQISGATSETYTLGTIDAGTGISVKIVCLDEPGKECETPEVEAGTFDPPPAATSWAYLRKTGNVTCIDGACVTTVSITGPFGGFTTGDVGTDGTVIQNPEQCKSVGLTSGCNPAPGTPCHPNIGVCELVSYNMTLLKNGSPVAGASAFSEDVAGYIAVPT